MSKKRLLILLLGTSVVVAGFWVAIAWHPAERHAYSGNPKERMEAVDKLGDGASERSLRLLAKLAEDRDERVAIEAVKNIGRADRQSEAGRQVLKGIAAGAPGGRIRGEAAASLGNYRATNPGDLTAMLRNEKDTAARVGALRGLARGAWPAAVPDMVEALTDPDPNVRMASLNALNKTVRIIRFEYDTSADPATMTEQLEGIKAALRLRKLL